MAYLDALVVQLITVVYSRLEPLSRLIGTIQISDLGTLHPSILVIDFGIYHTVPNGFRDDVLGILFRVEMKLEADILE